MKHWQTNLENFEIPLAKPGDNLIFLGSCFAENIGKKFHQLISQTLVNPLGIVYNPDSLASMLERSKLRDFTITSELEENEGMFHHMDFHGAFSHSDPDEAIKKINEGLSILNTQLSKTKIVYISLGTAFVFSRKADNKTISNCHKFPSKLFARKLLSYSETLRFLQQIIQILLSFNSEIKIVFSISPIRHIRDGLIENNYSKSVLLAAAKEMIKQYSHLYYFPAYEIMMDELRDYRFYADDMIHPSTQAINYIFNIFLEKSFSQKDILTLKKIEKIKQFISHRPIHNNARKQRYHIMSIMLKLSGIQKENPELDLTEIEESLQRMLQ